MKSTSSTDPTVVIHWGDEPYLHLCVRAASHHCRVHLIGTHPSPPAAFYPIGDYRNGSGDFPAFRREAPGEPWRLPWTRRCFARWWVAQHWMERHRVERALFLDSDVLMYHHPVVTLPPPQEASTRDATLWSWAVTTTLLTRYTIGVACDSMLDRLAASQGTEPMDDMAGFHPLLDANRAMDWALPHNGYAVDHNLHVVEGWRADPATGDKALEWGRHGPVATTKAGTKIALCTLHMWSDRKERMAEYYHKVYR